MGCLDLQPGLNAGAEDRRGRDRFRRQMASRHGTGRRRSQIGQVAIVQQYRVDEPGLCIEQHHHAVEARQPE